MKCCWRWWWRSCHNVLLVQVDDAVNLFRLATKLACWVSVVLQRCMYYSIMMMMDDQLPHHRRSPLFSISSNNLLWLQLNASSFRRARSYFILYPGALQYNSNAVTTSPWKKLHFLFSPNASFIFYIINFGHILILYDGDFVCIWIWRFGSAFSGITMTKRLIVAKLKRQRMQSKWM